MQVSPPLGGHMALVHQNMPRRCIRCVIGMNHTDTLDLLHLLTSSHARHTGIHLQAGRGPARPADDVQSRPRARGQRL
eukprot:9289-Eustigmatos_ZCMA.PRE.1